MLKLTYPTPRSVHHLWFSGARMFGYDYWRGRRRPIELFPDGQSFDYQSVSYTKYLATKVKTDIITWPNEWVSVSPAENETAVCLARRVEPGTCYAHVPFLLRARSGRGWYVGEQSCIGQDLSRGDTILFRTAKGLRCFTERPIEPACRPCMARGSLVAKRHWSYGDRASLFFAAGRPDGGVYVFDHDARVSSSTEKGDLVEVARLKPPHNPKQWLDHAVVSPDGSTLALVWQIPHYSGAQGLEQTVAIYSLPDMTLRRAIDVPMDNCQFSPDGMTLWGPAGDWPRMYNARTVYAIDLD